LTFQLQETGTQNPQANRRLLKLILGAVGLPIDKGGDKEVDRQMRASVAKEGKVSSTGHFNTQASGEEWREEKIEVDKNQKKMVHGGRLLQSKGGNFTYYL